jgi:hypothetical protein
VGSVVMMWSGGVICVEDGGLAQERGRLYMLFPSHGVNPKYESSKASSHENKAIMPSDSGCS